MDAHPPSDVTELLQAWSRGEPSALEKLTPLVYQELHRLAHRRMQGSNPWQDFWMLDLTTKKTRQLSRLDNRAAMRTFDITPDGKQIVFDRLRENSDVVLIDLAR